MDLEQKRAVAALATVPGYAVLLDQLVKPLKTAAMSRLLTAKQEQEVLDAALDLRAWERVETILRETPQRLVEELKKEGDAIYG